MRNYELRIFETNPSAEAGRCSRLQEWLKNARITSDSISV